MKSTILLSLIILLTTLPAAGHHLSSEGHDMTRPVTLAGVVTAIDWHNPHVFASLDVKDKDGKTVNWRVTMSSASSMKMLGMARDTFKPGDHMSVDVWLARDGSPNADVREGSSLVLPNGLKVVFPLWVMSLKVP